MKLYSAIRERQEINIGKGMKVLLVIGLIICLGLIFTGLLIGYTHINWTVVDPWILKALELHKKGSKAYYGFFFVSIVIYIIYATHSFRKDPEKFTDDIWKLRKVLYVLFLIVISIGIVLGYVDFRDWKILLQLTAIIIFVDLAVFQTPSITKIWNAEFQHRSKIEKTIEVNVEFIASTGMKLQIFSDAIKKTEDYFDPISTIPNNWNSYQRELKRYLSLYTSEFRFRLELFPFQLGVDEAETRQRIDRAFSQLETLFLYEVDDTPGKENQPGLRTQTLNSLANGVGSIIEKDKLIVIPIFSQRNSLMGIRANDASRIDEVDITNIVNMVRIFDWYM
jgi:hypothetical protein